MYQLVYASAAREAFDEVTLETLLVRVREKNAAVDVTGILLYAGGSFVQVLEGDKEVVEGLFAAISRDRRHHRVLRLLASDTDERRFPEWRMGYVALDPERVRKELPGYSDFLRRPWDLHGDMSAARVETLLDRFRSGDFRQSVRG